MSQVGEQEGYKSFLVENHYSVLIYEDLKIVKEKFKTQIENWAKYMDSW